MPRPSSTILLGFCASNLLQSSKCVHPKLLALTARARLQFLLVMNSLTPKANTEDLDALDTPAGQWLSWHMGSTGSRCLWLFAGFFTPYFARPDCRSYYSSSCWRCQQPFSHSSSLPEYLRHVEAPGCRPAPRHAAKDEICSVEEHGPQVMLVQNGARTHVGTCHGCMSVPATRHGAKGRACLSPSPWLQLPPCAAATL